MSHCLSCKEFEDAIKEGRLSKNPSDKNYVSNYMYMGNNSEGKSLFKNTLTREYIK